MPGRTALIIEIRKWFDAAILVLSARHSDQEKVALLDARADDHVTKPFSTIELKARVRALLRRSAARGSNGATTIQCGDLKMDLDARSLTRIGILVRLTPIEWELLRALITHSAPTPKPRHVGPAPLRSGWPPPSSRRGNRRQLRALPNVHRAAA